MTDTERRLAAVLAEHEPLPILESGPILIGYGCPAPCSWGNEGGYGLDAHRKHLAAALLPVVAEIEAEARAAERERVAAAIAGSCRRGFGMRPDGTEDPTAAAYVEGLHDAWAIARTAEGDE